MAFLDRMYKNAQDFFIGAAVLGQFGHSIALEMAGIIAAATPMSQYLLLRNL